MTALISETDYSNQPDNVAQIDRICSRSRIFPSWHFSMMNDANRNLAIENSIKDIDLEEKIVFEIGTGAGLAAMLFAHHGAKHVITCEMDSQLYNVAKKNIADSGFQNRITVINSSSSDFIDSGDLDFVPDVIFTETLDCGVVGEGFHHVANDISRV